MHLGEQAKLRGERLHARDRSSCAAAESQSETLPAPPDCVVAAAAAPNPDPERSVRCSADQSVGRWRCARETSERRDAGGAARKPQHRHRWLYGSRALGSQTGNGDRGRDSLKRGRLRSLRGERLHARQRTSCAAAGAQSRTRLAPQH